MAALYVAQRKTMKLGVVRKEPEIVRPAKPTPQEIKELSDIDDQKGLRHQMPAIMFYRANESMKGKDPVKVVKEGLAKALVFYYPLAGRLRARPGNKHVVDCNGEGTLFIEADAEARLEDFGDEMHPPFPLEELLYNVPGTQDIVDTPLLIVQVTRLKCGGCIVTLRSNHVLADATGIMQFMNALGEMARGLSEPLVLPVWERERLTARPQPCVTFDHHEYDESIKFDTPPHNGESIVQRSFILGPTEIAALKSHVPPENLNGLSTFDIMSASLWRCRTRALRLDPSEEVRLIISVNARNKFNPPLPKSYYGNACAFPVVRATAGEISSKPISHVLELIKQAKQKVTEEYMRSVADFLVIRGKPPLTADHRVFDLSDLRHLRFADVDFGWGKPVYGGPPDNGVIGEIGSYLISFRNKKGENMIVVPMAFPSSVMERFANELLGMLKPCRTMKLGVVRKEPEFVKPAEPAPQEIKELSDIDDQRAHWHQMPAIMFYRADESKKGEDPVKVVKEGLAKALVFYYPLAGRLRAQPGNKLVVDCTGEGALFIEADAEARLDDFGDEMHPPFPLEELLYDVPGTQDIVDTPLLQCQVTRLKCGGFVVALRHNHVLADATGTMQFMNAVGEMARGLPEPVVRPVWQRERLKARPQPRVTYEHHEYDESIERDTKTHEDDSLDERCFIFGPTEIAALTSHVAPENFKSLSTFDIMSASLWRCRTKALQLDPSEEVRLIFAVNARNKFNPPIPKGYYGNACASPVVRATAGEICEEPISHVLELIKQAKQQVTEEYMRSVADFLVIEGKPAMTVDHRVFDLSDLRHLQFAKVDFGWGKPVYGGPPNNGVLGDVDSYLISFKNKKGENVIVVPMAAPSTVMERFVQELRGMLKPYN